MENHRFFNANIYIFKRSIFHCHVVVYSEVYLHAFHIIMLGCVSVYILIYMYALCHYDTIIWHDLFVLFLLWTCTWEEAHWCISKNTRLWVLYEQNATRTTFFLGWSNQVRCTLSWGKYSFGLLMYNHSCITQITCIFCFICCRCLQTRCLVSICRILQASFGQEFQVVSLGWIINPW